MSKVLAAFLLAAFQIAASEKTDHAWLQLGHLPRDGIYQFSERSGSCLSARLDHLAHDAVKVVTTSSNASQFQVLSRSGLVRVADGPLLEDVLYSGRSSWEDIRFVPKSPSERFRLILKSNETVAARPLRTSKTTITVRSILGKQIIQRADIAQVIYLRLKPLSSQNDYLIRESSYMVFVLPVFWQYVLKLGVDLPVLLYDSSIPQDDRKLACGP